MVTALRLASVETPSIRGESASTETIPITLSAKTFEVGRRNDATRMAILAYTTLALVFMLDAVTPQTLSVEIAYEGSVVVAALSGNRRLIVRVLSVTLLGDALGGILEAVREGVDVIGIENRLA